MIDWAYVNGLCNDIGRDSFDEIIQVFFEEVEDTLKHLENLPNQIDITEELHFLQECRKRHEILPDNLDELRHTANLLATYKASKIKFLSAINNTGLQ